MSDKCKCAKSSEVVLSVDDYGQYGSRKIKQFTWKNSTGTTIRLINYGGHITSICLPDKNGKIDDIVVGFNDLDGYLGSNDIYFGCTVGRFANRIAKGKMTIEGVEYNLAKNDGSNHLHGGVRGFDKVVWDYSIKGNQVTLSYASPDMEEGYPGTLLVNVTFELNSSNEFVINYKAMTTKPTVVNLTNHSYFNLAGDSTGAEELYKHMVKINAPHITEIDDELIPTGKYLDVLGTVFDFQEPVRLGDVIDKVPNSSGFDHNFCISQTRTKLEQMIANVIHPQSGRRMEIYSDLPGVQFYTGNLLPEDKSIPSKTGGYYQKHGAFCMETQGFPDAMNHSNFPSPLLQSGDIFDTTTKLKFSVENTSEQ
ncbi:galactose mutarotase-like [Diorhabda carinulata]|uniref:galactose mutarotase-like n=1 Tax=Diorhabda carinulata TaxID=1163345 RepID=UPI0025A0F4ED|nr:galactose mutarotase-like [Diorhabda carinulata]